MNACQWSRSQNRPDFGIIFTLSRYLRSIQESHRENIVNICKIKNIAILQRQEDGKWVEVSRYIYDAKKEDFPTEDLSGMTNEFTVKNQKTGYYYRVVGVHYVESNGKGQSFMTKTDGIKITEYGD